jgi:hypothetical protein
MHKCTNVSGDVLLDAAEKSGRLAQSQRSMVAKDMVPFYEEGARERLKASTGGTHPQLAAQMQEADKGEARERQIVTLKHGTKSPR